MRHEFSFFVANVDDPGIIANTTFDFLEIDSRLSKIFLFEVSFEIIRPLMNVPEM
jgi:hypothetical protein